MTLDLDAASALQTRTFRGALFDMDGTLIDSTPAVLRSWARLAAEQGVQTDLGTGNHHGRPARELLASILPADQVEQALARVTQLEIDDTDGVVALPGALDLLTALPEHSWTIVTSCTQALADVRIAASGIPRPDSFVTFDDVVAGKPDPEPFETGAARLGAHPSDCVAFEDAPAGLASARAAGCFTIGLPGTHTPDELDADVVLTSLEQLSIELIEGGFRLSVAA
ncbi:HAD-IA family hydrolase [Paramicrobacterium chengjingii]|uniref:HAD-IA family hydrolase n=1 Tax=Paramicrobacterium chengjingii TaxID=2769067 RepID=A0ABX6YGM7_9MICO|nr:HAD-IA family hydrolase [Microbacterium chengjingii]QPZ37946.1 HAD-IA family hydrolase [Microbacterium chengjingii]